MKKEDGFTKLVLSSVADEHKKAESEEEEKEIQRHADFLHAMMDYMYNVTPNDLMLHLFDKKRDEWADADGYYSDKFNQMYSNLFGFLSNCDDKRIKAIVKQSLKVLKGEGK